MYEQQGNGALNDFLATLPSWCSSSPFQALSSLSSAPKMFFSLPSRCQKGGRALVVAACVWVSPYVWLVQVAGTHQQRHHGVG